MSQQNYSDVFTFDPNYTYQIRLVTGELISGIVIETYDNGIVLNNLMHIPTDKIVYFSPVQRHEENETDEKFVV
jgi:hypothetical protein